MLSCILPAYKEPHLQRTVDSLLENAEGEIEVIVVLDGYWPDIPLKADDKVHILHFGENRGMRAAINGGVALAKGEWLLKSDAHCVFGKGYDNALLEDAKENEVYIPRRFRLDTDKWEVIEGQPIDYEKLIKHRKVNKLTGEEWRSRARARKDILVDETMTFQGSCWMMSRKHWDSVIGELKEEGYGRFAHEPLEIGMKTWASGGRIMVNKKTWYAHKHREISRTHQVSEKELNAAYTYAMETWKDEFEKLKTRFGI